MTGSMAGHERMNYWWKRATSAEAELAEARSMVRELDGANNDEQDATDAANARLQAVRELHVPDVHGPGRCDDPDCKTWCQDCNDDWPCATIRVLDGDLA